MYRDGQKEEKQGNSNRVIETRKTGINNKNKIKAKQRRETTYNGSAETALNNMRKTEE